MSELPVRPAPPQSIADRIRGWIEWVGAARLVASAVVVLAVVAGAYWLVRPPAATTESKLPYAGTASTTSTSAAAPANTAVTSTTVGGTVVVHVAGAVQAPGVYELPAGSRAIDAVGAAGGTTADANPDAINLAAPIVDGQRLYVPRVGETVPALADMSSAATGSTAAPGPVNLNSATADELDSLPGVGPATAAAILAYREEHGAFASVDDLAEVRGIGPAKLEALRGLVTV